MQLNKKKTQQTQHASRPWILDKSLLSRLPLVALLWSTCWLLTGCDVPGSSLTPQPANLIGLGNPGDGPNQACMLTVEALSKEPSEKNFELFFKERRAEVIWTFLYKYVGSDNLQYHNLTDMNADAICKLEVVNKVLVQQNSIGRANLCNAIALYIDLKKQEAEFRDFLHCNKLDEVWNTLQSAKTNRQQTTLDLKRMLQACDRALKIEVLTRILEFICSHCLDLSHCPDLVQLSLPDDELTALPYSFETLTELKTNQLTRFSNSCVSLNKLTIPALNDSQTPSSRISVTNKPIEDLTEQEIAFQAFLNLNELDEVWRLLEKANNNPKDPLHLSGILHNCTPAVQTRVLKDVVQFILNRIPGLVALSLSNNGLIALPESLGELTQLQRLNLCYNKLATLPDSFVKLINLKQIDLSDNQLTQFPACLADLTQLQGIELSGNQLRFLPEYLQKLTNLRDFSVYNNPLVQPNADITEISKIGVELTINNLYTLLSPSLFDLAREIIIRQRISYETKPIPQDCINAIQNPKTYRVMVFTTQLGHLTLHQTVPIVTQLSYQEIRGLVHKKYQEIRGLVHNKNKTKVILMN